MTSPRDVIARAVDGPDSADPSVACYAEADGIIQALKHAGLVIVPREPTEAMVSAAMRTCGDDLEPTHDELADFHRAMVKAYEHG